MAMHVFYGNKIDSTCDEIWAEDKTKAGKCYNDGRKEAWFYQEKIACFHWESQETNKKKTARVFTCFFSESVRKVGKYR